MNSVTARAPSSTANLGPGFDVFGLALDAFYDEVQLTKQKHGISIITDDSIPVSPRKNTTGLVVEYMKKKNSELKVEFKLESKKVCRLVLEWEVVQHLQQLLQLHLTNYLVSGLMGTL